MQFYVVYIQEAHPSDSWQLQVNEFEGVVFSQPTTKDERTELAAACELRLEMSIPTLLDEMSNEVDAAYAALPDRLYLIDDKGDFAYRSGRGPMGFRPYEFEEAIQAHLDGRSAG